MPAAVPWQPLSPAKLSEAGATLAAAFHDDPFSLFLLPDERSRPRWLRMLNSAALRLAFPEGHVYTAAGEGVPAWCRRGATRCPPGARCAFCSA